MSKEPNARANEPPTEDEIGPPLQPKKLRLWQTSEPSQLSSVSAAPSIASPPAPSTSSSSTTSTSFPTPETPAKRTIVNVEQGEAPAASCQETPPRAEDCPTSAAPDDESTTILSVRSCLNRNRASRRRRPRPRITNTRTSSVTVRDGSSEDEDEDDDEDGQRFHACRLIQFDGTYDEEVVPVPRQTATTSENNEREPTVPESLRFDWRSFPQVLQSPNFPEQRIEQFTETEGATQQISDSYDVFTAIWDQQIMQHIVDETNKYAQQLVQVRLDQGQLENSRVAAWTDTTIDEMFIYFAMIIAMAIYHKSKLKDYFYCDGKITDTPNFARYMSYGRFVLLNSCVHFRDNMDIQRLIDQKPMTRSEVKIAKIQPVVSHLNIKFRELFSLGHNIVLDVRYMNHSVKNRTIPELIRCYELCDALTGYLWRFEIHQDTDTDLCGENSQPEGDDDGRVENPSTSPFAPGSISSLVMRMIRGLEHTHRTVWMNSHFNNPALARRLKSLGLDCVGTLNTNQPFVPDSLKYLDKAKMNRGDIYGCTSGDVDLIVWKDKNRIPMISTYHGIEVTTSHEKPDVVLDYNKIMSSLDCKDCILASYPIERKHTTVWYKRFFRSLLNVSVNNTYILMQDVEGERQVDQKAFRSNLVTDILARHAPRRVLLEPCKSGRGSSIATHVPVFSEEFAKHLPKQYGLYPGPKNERKRKNCKVCVKRTQYFCAGCSVPLCAFNDGDEKSCHEAYHS